jgi:hypothetical protein
VLKEDKDFKEYKVLKGQLDHKVLRVLKVLKDFLVYLDL